MNKLHYAGEVGNTFVFRIEKKPKKKMKSKSGKQLIDEIAQRRKEFNYWKAKATQANKRTIKARLQILSTVKKFTPKDRELYNEKIERLTKNVK